MASLTSDLGSAANAAETQARTPTKRMGRDGFIRMVSWKFLLANYSRFGQRWQAQRRSNFDQSRTGVPAGQPRIRGDGGRTLLGVTRSGDRRDACPTLP